MRLIAIATASGSSGAPRLLPSELQGAIPPGWPPMALDCPLHPPANVFPRLPVDPILQHPHTYLDVLQRTTIQPSTTRFLRGNHR